MIKKCTKCDVELTEVNRKLHSGTSYRNTCKSCLNQNMVSWKRNTGRIKEYPCKTCQKPIIRIDAKLFCSDECRFNSYINKTESCWLWTGYRQPNGYGRICFRGVVSEGAHRASYTLFKGPIEDGMFVCHSCDVKLCVNPDHLWAGTHMENMLDMLEKGRKHTMLSPYDALDIRKLAREKRLSVREIAEKYNTDTSHVYKIIKRKKWVYV